VGPQAAEHRGFESVSPDVQAVVAGALVPRRRASVELMTRMIRSRRFLNDPEIDVTCELALYLFLALRWAPIHGLELLGRLKAYFARMKEVPSVARALVEEGLV
jgi:hypothetical protein